MIQTATYRKIFSRVGFCYFLLMGFTNIFQAAAAMLIMRFAPNFAQSDWYMWVVSYIPLYCLAVPLFLLVVRLLLPENAPAPQPQKMGIARFFMILVLSMGSMYVLNIVSMVLVTGIGMLTGTPAVNPILSVAQSSSLLGTALFGCVLAPVGEELLFRKLLYHKLGVLGDRCYILTAGFIFALFHGNLSQMLYAFALGALFAYVYVRTGRILYTIALHMIVNCIGILAAPLAVQSPVATMVLGMVVLASIAGGIAILCLRWKSARFDPPALELPAHPVSNALLTPGMIFYMALCLCLVLVFLFPNITTEVMG